MPLIRLSNTLQPSSSFSLFSCLRVLVKRQYSMYPPTFIEPVYHPKQLEKLSSEEARELLNRNIRPPKTNQNASIFHDPLLEKLVNHVMQGGKKAIARRIIEDTFEKIKRAQIRKYHLAKDADKEKIPTNPLEIFHKALQNCKPVLDVVPVKKGGVMYKVPVAISDHRATSLAFKWLVASAREHPPRRDHTGEYFSDRLANELMGAISNSGKSYKKKIDLHKLCEANKAYAHFRWTK